MINEKMRMLGAKRSVIRELFEYGKKRAEIVGPENVYDFSLGNPATPAPEELNQAIIDLVKEGSGCTANAMELHGYMENAGYPEVRGTIADNLNQRFGTSFTSGNIVMTVGAAGGLNIIFKTILDPEDEVMVFAPYFGEYRQYAANFAAHIVEVQPNTDTFQPDLEDFERKIERGEEPTSH